MKMFEIIPHTADLQMRVYGKNVKELFNHALIGMFQAIKPIAPECTYINDLLICPSLPKQHTIEINSIDQNSLLVDFLSEALYLSDTHNQAYLDATIIELTETFVKATLHGIAITGFQALEIKAVTYHNLAIKKINDLWQVDIVFDI